MKKIILGSASPRRKELLSQIGVPFEVRVSNKEEVYTNTVPKEIVKELREYGIEPVLVDQTADRAEAKRLYGVELQDMSAVKDVDALVIAVCHKEFEGLDQAAIESFFNPTNGKKVLVDVKGILNRKEWTRDDCLYWRL